MLFRVRTDPFLYCTVAAIVYFFRPVAVNIYTPSDVALVTLAAYVSYKYWIRIRWKREDELSVLEATFFIDVAKPSTIDTVDTIVYFMPSFFRRFIYLIFYLAK